MPKGPGAAPGGGPSEGGGGAFEQALPGQDHPQSELLSATAASDITAAPISARR